ncbi:MAG TPA: head GIN domain-containing protein [Bacteroidia bacterium]|nr:head GIN domain-containing protein [Bacteroidia bacterium]
MKTNQTILAVITVGLLFQGCQKGSMWGIKGEGENVTEYRSISGVNGIDLSIDADIRYVQDSVYSLQINGQANILSILETKVEGGVFKLDFKRNVWNHNHLYLEIHAPEMKKISISGSGNIEVAKRIDGAHLDLGISGSGNITIPTVSLQSMDVKLSGSGNVAVKSGTCTSEYFNISGGGQINCEFVNCNAATAKVSGSGNITLSASGSLNVTISGSGNVRYRGNPVVNTDISGSGKVIHLN